MACLKQDGKRPSLNKWLALEQDLTTEGGKQSAEEDLAGIALSMV